MNMKSRINYVILGAALVGLISFISIAFAQSSSNEDKRIQTTKVNKTLPLSALWQNKVVIRVSGMQDVDAVNIRPASENKISARILTVDEQEVIVSGNRKLRLPKNGEQVSEDLLSINENEISFVRPLIDGKVLVDIELPESTRIEVFFNNESIVKNTVVYSPLSIRAGKIGKGEEHLGTALSRVMFPQLINRRPNSTVKIENDKYHVPFSNLQLKKSNELTVNDVSVKALIEINEQGLVEKVSVIEPLNSSQIEQEIRQWEFIPYKKDGVAVKVSTFFMKEQVKK